MRNIYDIIEEQKALVDVNMAIYDLQYTNEFCLENLNMYSVNEGVGEAIKKAGKKAVEIIRSIISAIRNLVGKVTGFFKKSENEVDKMEKQIKAAANSVGSSGAAKVAADGAVDAAKAAADKAEKKEDKKPEGPKAPKVKDIKKAPEKKEEKKHVTTDEGGARSKVGGLLDLLKSSDLKVDTYHWWPLKNYVQKMEEILGSIDAHTLNAVDDKDMKPINLDDEVNKDVFEGRRIQFTDSVRDYFNGKLDGRKTKDLKVSWNAEVIYDYAANGRSTVQHFQKIAREAEDHLNKLIKSLDSNPDDRLEAIAIKGANMTNVAVTEFSRTITRATSVYIAVCRKVTNDYCAKMGYKKE